MEKIVINKFAQYAKEILSLMPMTDLEKSRQYRIIWEKHYGKITNKINQTYEDSNQ